MDIRRGFIYYVYRDAKETETGCEQQSGRPAIIVSNNANNAYSRTVEVVYLTTKEKPDLPTHVTIRSSRKISIALCEQIFTVSIERIGDFIGCCSDAEMDSIDLALACSIGICLAPDRAEQAYELKPRSEPVGDYHTSTEVNRLRTLLIHAKSQAECYEKAFNMLLEKVTANA